MKKIVFSVIFLLSFLISVPFVFAQKNPSLTVSDTTVSIFNIENQSRSIDLTVKNNEDVTDIFSVSIFPSSWNKVSVDAQTPILSIDPGVSSTIKIYFTPVAEADIGISSFVITVKSMTNPEISSNQTILVRVQRRSPVFVLGVVTDKYLYEPEETVTITTTVTNIGNVPSEEYALQTTIMRGGETIKRFNNFVTSLPEKSKKEFVNGYTVEKFALPGTYSINSVLINSLGFTINSGSVNFQIKEVANKVSEKKSTSVGFLAATIVIVAKNEGNVPTQIKITALMPMFAKDLFVPEIQPASKEVIGNTVVYSWVFDNVLPNTEVEMKYQFVLWHVWLALIIISVIVYLAFRFVFTPTIVKKSKYVGPLTKEKEISITLEVKNKSMYEVKDLFVRDFVPPMTKVVPRFETMKPTIKETTGGTELVWKFDSLKSGEERVLTYRVKPIMDVVGTLRLPNALLRYVDNKKQKKSIVSSSLTLMRK